MKILILEDNEQRIEFFNRVYKNHKLFITSDINTAVSYVQNNEFDILFLDHDLELENFKALTEGRTGYDFCKVLVEYKLQRQATIFIHSMNPVGGAVMERILRDNGYEAQWVPFHLLRQEER